jgi:glycosyltransferase involved in cell wall biosynthesis
MAAVDAPKPAPHPGGGVRLLSVGRLEKQKGFDRMIAALAAPTLRELNWSWTLVGDGAARESLNSQITQAGLEGRVHLVGSAPAHAYFGQSDMVLCPSRFEGMPLVPLEAIEAGVPVLSSAIFAHTELFGQVQESILPEDESLWPQRLAALISDRSARDRIVAQQSGLLGDNPRERLWNDYRNIYESLL